MSLRHCWAGLGLSVPTVTSAHVWHWPCNVGWSGWLAPGSRADCSRCSLNPDPLAARPSPAWQEEVDKLPLHPHEWRCAQGTEVRTGGDSISTMLEETTARAASHGNTMCQGHVYGDPPGCLAFLHLFLTFYYCLGSRMISAHVRCADRPGGRL